MCRLSAAPSSCSFRVSNKRVLPLPSGPCQPADSIHRCSGTANQCPSRCRRHASLPPRTPPCPSPASDPPRLPRKTKASRGLIPGPLAAPACVCLANLRRRFNMSFVLLPTTTWTGCDLTLMLERGIPRPTRPRGIDCAPSLQIRRRLLLKSDRRPRAWGWRCAKKKNPSTDEERAPAPDSASTRRAPLAAAASCMHLYTRVPRALSACATCAARPGYAAARRRERADLGAPDASPPVQRTLALCGCMLAVVLPDALSCRFCYYF